VVLVIAITPPNNSKANAVLRIFTLRASD
jgi:hypothetical protein